MLRRDGRKWYVHRWVWTLMHGPIPKGVQVLHRCDNPACFRLDHLFLGTQGDNMRDMVEKGRHSNQLKTHCKHGHEFTADNTVIVTNPNGQPARRCRTCRNAASLASYYRKMYSQV